MLFFYLGLLLCSLSFADVLESSPVLIDYEQNPSSMNWKKIDTEHFEVIFPEEVEKDAQRVSHLLEAAFPLVTRSLQVSPKKISLILQNQSTISNGFVTLAPRRSEFYMTPAIDPELTNTEWLKTLAIHEFRHIVQFQKSRRGINEIYEIFLGEIGQALGLGLTMPPWFLEGDAVGIETALTKGGRGRLPLFERDLKALLLSGKNYNYDKSHLGSYKDFIPSHYTYGYFYTSAMRNKHGDLFLSHLVEHSASTSYNPLSFYNAYERVTGVKFEKFFKATLQDLIKNWKEKEAKLSLTPFDVKNVPLKKVWTNYLYPQEAGPEKFLALKKGLSHISQFVLTNGRKDETVVYPGALNNEYPYKLRSHRLAWVEWELDPRWGYRNFSRIKVYDLKEKKFVSDLRKTKGRLAVLDQSGTFILYVNWDETQGQHIVVTDLAGKEVHRISYPREKVITSIDWFSPNEVVFVAKNMSDLKEVVKLSLEDKSETSLVAPTLSNFGFITAQEGRVLVESPESGIDNIFEVKDSKLVQLTSSRFGAYAPTLASGKLVYNDYSAQGMNIASKKLPWDEEQKSEGSFSPVFEKLALSENTTGALEQNFFDQKNYPSSTYSQAKNALNFHSWFIIAPPLSSVISVQALSRDVLNKFALSFGSNYDLNEKEVEGFVSAAWSHYYPVFDIRAAYGGRNNGRDVDGPTDHWEEGTFEAGVQVPWNRIDGRFTQSFNLRGFAKVIKVTGKEALDRSEINDGALFSPGAEAEFSYTSRLAPRDLNPELGGTLVAHIEEGRDITGVNMNGSLFSADSRFFFPGLMKHHSFFHQLGYERQRSDEYQYSTILLRPRGTSSFFLQEASKYSGNYLFPVFYPDWNLSRYVYLKRVSLNLFYDTMNATYVGSNYKASSTGWEVLLDTHFARIFIPFTLGIRGSYILEGVEKSNNYEFFITTLGGYF